MPGDEIVQVNEQVVVSEEERDMVGVKGLLSRTEGCWVEGTLGETRVVRAALHEVSQLTQVRDALAEPW